MKKLLMPTLIAASLFAATWTTRAADSGAAIDEAKLIGTWKMDVTSGDNTTDYELRFAKTDGKLEATQVSPRSGDHPCKSITTKGNELEMLLDRDQDGQTVTYIYKGNFTQVKNIYTTDKTYGLGDDGLAWVKSTVNQFLADSAKDAKLDALTAEYKFYFGVPAR